MRLLKTIISFLLELHSIRAIPTPEQFLGYPVGDWHTRHDRIVSYFQELARVSPKAHFQIIGYTNERRPQVVLTITSPEKLRTH
jgi:hypothetical protein